MNAEFYSLVQFTLEDRDDAEVYDASEDIDRICGFQRLTPKTVVEEVPGVLFESAVPFHGDKLILGEYISRRRILVTKNKDK